MIRRFNYTRRKSIPAGHVAIRLLHAGTPDMSFDADVRLATLGLPPEAAVFVEAYYKASYMRFPFGTVGYILQPNDRMLSEIDRGTTVLFRVKVVGTTATSGRILAELDGIVASEAEPTAAGRHSLLPVNYKDLGQQVWRLELGSDRPVLELNSTINGIRDLATRDGRFLGLVFPAIVRQILTQVLLVLDHDDPDDPSDWRSLWLRFTARYHPEGPPRGGSPDSKQEWIEEAVASYCQAIRTKDLLVEARAEDAR